MRFLRRRCSGYGCLGLRTRIVWCKKPYLHILPCRQPYPKNRIPKAGAEETVSTKPHPESQDPKNRIRKTVPRKPGPKKTDPNRVWFLVGGVLDYDFPRALRISRTRFLDSGFWNTAFCLQGYCLGFLGYGFGDGIRFCAILVDVDMAVIILEGWACRVVTAREPAGKI